MSQNTRTLAMTILIIGFLAIPGVYAQAQVYPTPPPADIIVHTTTITYSGKPTTQFVFNVTETDSQSLVTEIAFNTSVPFSSLRIQIFQLSGFPPEIPTATGIPLLIIQIILPESVDNSTISATIDFKIPQNSISSAKVNPNTIVVQRYSQGSWSVLASKVVGSNSQFVYIHAQSPGLSVFAITATALPTPFPWFLLISILVVIVIVVAVGVLLVQRRRKASR